MLSWCLFPSLLRNSGNKHQNNTLVGTETVRHSSTYIILYNTTTNNNNNVDNDDDDDNDDGGDDDKDNNDNNNDMQAHKNISWE